MAANLRCGVASRNCFMPFSLESLQQRWRHECRRRRYACVPLHRAPVLDAELQCQVLPTLGPAIARQCHQQQRRMRSDYKEWQSLGTDGCKYAEICDAHEPQSPGDAGSAGHDGSASGRIRLWPGPVRTQTSATHAKTHRAAAPPPLTACLVQRRQTRAASLAATDARRQRPHLATDYRSPPRYRRAAAAPPASHNSQRQRSPKAAEP